MLSQQKVNMFSIRELILFFQKSSFRRDAPLTLALKNQFARGFKDFLCFRKLDVTVRVPIALQA